MDSTATDYIELYQRADLAERAAEQVDREGNGRLSRVFREHAKLWRMMAMRQEDAE
jgi:hypothetical protein